MTPQYTPERVQENRRKVVTHLRTTKATPGAGMLYNANEKCYCAWGHVGLAVGIDARTEVAYGTLGAYERISLAVGDHSGDAEQLVINMNDCEHRSLHDIGDSLAGFWGLE